MNILITGGAGFIGSRLAVRLVSEGSRVRIVDSLSEQIHGKDADFPGIIPGAVDCIAGSVCDRSLMSRLLGEAEVVVHLAAETGTGQSMYAVSRYQEVNIGGTATLLDILMNGDRKKLKKLVVASSRAIYGEGAYRCAAHGIVYPHARVDADMKCGDFEPKCPVCNSGVEVAATTEDAPFAPSSFYGLTKQVQEQMILLFARTLGISGIALRYQNVYGPGQSLSNPYTGLLAVFSNLVRAGKPIQVFEDGLESRDFVFVDDVVTATAACIRPDVSGVHSFNVGSGKRTTVLEVAELVRFFYKSQIPISVTGAYRVGDIRHNCADMSRIAAETGFRPTCAFEQGLNAFLEWASTSASSGGDFDRSLTELSERGLMKCGAEGSQSG